MRSHPNLPALPQSHPFYCNRADHRNYFALCPTGSAPDLAALHSRKELTQIPGVILAIAGATSTNQYVIRISLQPTPVELHDVLVCLHSHSDIEVPVVLPM